MIADVLRTKLLEMAIAYHKSPEGEGEYGCPGATCPGVKRLHQFALDAVLITLQGVQEPPLCLCGHPIEAHVELLYKGRGPCNVWKCECKYVRTAARAPHPERTEPVKTLYACVACLSGDHQQCLGGNCECNHGARIPDPAARVPHEPPAMISIEHVKVAIEEVAAQANLCAGHIGAAERQRDWLRSEVRAVAQGELAKLKILAAQEARPAPPLATHYAM